MKYSIILPKKQQKISLKQLLEEDWLVPRKIRYHLKKYKGIEINSQIAKFHQIVNPNDKVDITLKNLETNTKHMILKFGDKDSIFPLYEDEHIIIIDKVEGKKTHPNIPNENYTVLNDLAAYLKVKKQCPYVIHRLDKETSGVIIFAKNLLILPILNKLLEKKFIHRRYQAIIWGKLNQSICINKKIGKHPYDSRKRTIDEKKGKKAITYVKVHKITEKKTKVYCTLDTGRTHQIRVHLSSLGYPIVGDPLYQKKSFKRILLHAYEIKFIHPFTKKKIKVTSNMSIW